MIHTKDSSRSRRVKASRKEEERVASTLGGKRLLASGALRSKLDGKSARGDLTAQGFWIEQKSTEATVLRVPLAWLQKVKAGASAQAQWPALSITFQGLKVSWIGIEYSVFQQVCEVFYERNTDWYLLSTEKQSIAIDVQVLRQEEKSEHPGICLQFAGAKPWIFIPLERFAKIMEVRRGS